MHHIFSMLAIACKSWLLDNSGRCSVCSLSQTPALVRLVGQSGASEEFFVGESMPCPCQPLQPYMWHKQRLQATMGTSGALSEAAHATTALRWTQTWGSSSACTCARQGPTAAQPSFKATCMPVPEMAFMQADWATASRSTSMRASAEHAVHAASPVVSSLSVSSGACVQVLPTPGQGVGKGTGWYLEEIMVSGEDGTKQSFPCNCWLGKSDAGDFDGVPPLTACSSSSLRWHACCCWPPTGGLWCHLQRQLA